MATFLALRKGHFINMDTVTQIDDYENKIFIQFNQPSYQTLSEHTHVPTGIELMITDAQEMAVVRGWLEQHLRITNDAMAQGI